MTNKDLVGKCKCKRWTLKQLPEEATQYESTHLEVAEMKKVNQVAWACSGTRHHHRGRGRGSSQPGLRQQTHRQGQQSECAYCGGSHKPGMNCPAYRVKGSNVGDLTTTQESATKASYKDSTPSQKVNPKAEAEVGDVADTMTFMG